MARPAGGYRNAEGKKIPGTTTITGHRKADVEGLLVWANRLGQEGLGHREARDAAASIGTVVHDMVEAHSLGRSAESVRKKYAMLKPDQFNAADQGFHAYLEWIDQTRFEVVETEMPLVSEEYQFGGTPDAIFEKDGKLALGDWKSSNAIYPDYIVQLAAYRQLWRENREQDLDSFHLLRFGKEFGDFHHHSWPVQVLDLAWDAFKHMRDLYEIDKQLKKAAA